MDKTVDKTLYLDVCEYCGDLTDTPVADESGEYTYCSESCMLDHKKEMEEEED